MQSDPSPAEDARAALDFDEGAYRKVVYGDDPEGETGVEYDTLVDHVANHAARAARLARAYQEQTTPAGPAGGDNRED